MILDSCILIDLSRNLDAAVDYVTSLSKAPAISVLTVTEVMRGVRRVGEAELTSNMLAGWEKLTVTLDIASLAADFLRKYGPSHGLDVVDAVIAATAQVHGHELVTLNLKHFPMFPGLKRPY
jgi:predicted nucleic acid-binding protein